MNPARHLYICITALFMLMGSMARAQFRLTPVQLMNGKNNFTCMWNEKYPGGKEGVVYIEMSYILLLHSDSTVTGMVNIRNRVDDMNYRSSAAVNGKYNYSMQSLSLQWGNFTSTDRLPGNLKWCKARGDYNLFIDDKNKYQYVLEGIQKDECGKSTNVSFSFFYTPPDDY